MQLASIVFKLFVSLGKFLSLVLNFAIELDIPEVVLAIIEFCSDCISTVRSAILASCWDSVSQPTLSMQARITVLAIQIGFITPFPEFD